MDITIKNWFEIHRVSDMWFWANILIYKEKPFNNNLIKMFDIDFRTNLEDVLKKIPKKLHNKKIKTVGFCRGEESDSVNIEICI